MSEVSTLNQEILCHKGQISQLEADLRKSDYQSKWFNMLISVIENNGRQVTCLQQDNQKLLSEVSASKQDTFVVKELLRHRWEELSGLKVDLGKSTSNLILDDYSP